MSSLASAWFTTKPAAAQSSSVSRCRSHAKRPPSVPTKEQTSSGTGDKVTSNTSSVTSTFQLQSSSSVARSSPSFSANFPVSHLTLSILAQESQANYEERMAPLPGTEFCPSTNIVYMVHPNMAVTRETRINGKPIEVRYAGEYVFVESDMAFVFVNYVPCAHHNILCCPISTQLSLSSSSVSMQPDIFEESPPTRSNLDPSYCAHRAHTPIDNEVPERCSPNYLQNRWTILVHKLLALQLTESDIFFHC